MDGYVSKPVDVRRLFAEISRVQSSLDRTAKAVRHI
jgi:hypothetical protein